MLEIQEDADGDYKKIAQGVIPSEDASDIFLQYTTLDGFQSHISYIEKIHNFGSKTKCPHCDLSKWSRRTDGCFRQTSDGYDNHLAQCPERYSSTSPIPTFCKPGSEISYRPYHPVYEFLQNTQMRCVNYLAFHIEMSTDSGGGTFAPISIEAKAAKTPKLLSFVSRDEEGNLLELFVQWLKDTAARKLIGQYLGRIKNLLKPMQPKLCCKYLAGTPNESTPHDDNCSYFKLRRELMKGKSSDPKPQYKVPIRIPINIVGFKSGRLHMIYLLQFLSRHGRIANVIIGPSSSVLSVQWDVHDPTSQRQVRFEFVDLANHCSGNLEDFAKIQAVTMQASVRDTIIQATEQYRGHIWAGKSFPR